MMAFLYVAYVLSSMIVAWMALKNLAEIRETGKMRTLNSAPFKKLATKGDFAARIFGWIIIAFVPPCNMVFAFVEILDIIFKLVSKTKLAKWWKTEL